MEASLAIQLNAKILFSFSSEYSSSLPFLLVLGVATTVSAIHMKLPHHVSSYLSIDTFSGQKATELMTKVVEEVVIDDAVPFKLGGGCLELLLEIFLFSDFSVKKFLSAYKVVKHELQGGTLLLLPPFSTIVRAKIKVWVPVKFH